MASNHQSAIIKGLRLLRDRDLSRAEFTLRLQQLFSEDEVTSAISFLDQYRLLDDFRIAARSVELNTGKRAVGDQLLKEKMRSRGIPDELIEIAFEANEIDEVERAWAVVNAKFAQGATRAKIARYLWSKGFSEETIESILQSIPESDLED